MNRTALALALLLPAVAAWPQAEQKAAGLAFSGEASSELLYTITEPFDSTARTAGYAGRTSLTLDAVGGNSLESKVVASAIAHMVYGLGDETAMAFELKKLYLSIYTPHVDLSAGRMIINYGRGTVFSPVDLFSAVDVSDLDLGRTGTDALRAQLPLGDFSGLDLVATLARPSGDGIAGGRFFGNASGWDFGMSAFGSGLADGDGDLVAGLDFKGDLELGLSAEAVARLPFSAWAPDAAEAVYSVMLGADYSVGGEWFFDFEYLANVRAGSTTAVGLFTASHNLFGSVSWRPDELTAVDLRCVAAPSEATVQATLSLSRSVASGASVAGYAVYQGLDTTSMGFGARLSVAY